MKGASFSRSAIALLVSCAVALFALSVLLHAYDNTPTATGGKYKPNTYSPSAIGHAGLYDLLRRLARPVSRSAGNTLAAVGARGTLIVAEPDLGMIYSADTMKLLTAPRLLVVLPKWRGLRDPAHPNWINEAQPLPLNDVQAAVSLVTSSATVFRKEWPKDWNANELGIEPTGSGTIQLMRSTQMRPIIGDGDGMLVGELITPNRRDRKVWVVTDPDILSNAGLGQGRNAELMVAIIDTLRSANNNDKSAHIVFDETIHGFRAAEGSPIKLMFRFPFVIITLLSCATAAVLAYAATGRFGAPRIPPRDLDFGKRGLISNGARLLDYAGHQARGLKRYVRMTIRSVAHTLHAPPNLDEVALVAWLDGIGNARGVSTSCAAILHATDDFDAGKPQNLTRLFETAQNIHRWKREILNGTSARRRHR